MFYLIASVQFSSVQSLNCAWLFVTPWIAARQASLSITNSWSSLRLTSIESVMPSSHLILCRPLLCPQSLPASASFPMSQLFTWGGQSTGVSALASFLPKKSQGWSPSEWTGWISLQSKGLSRVFSNTTVQKHQFFGAQLSSNSIGDLFVLVKISWLVIFSIRAVWGDIFYYFQNLDLILCVTVIQMSDFNSLILGLSSWKGTLRCVEPSGRSS